MWITIIILKFQTKIEKLEIRDAEQPHRHAAKARLGPPMSHAPGFGRFADYKGASPVASPGGTRQQTETDADEQYDEEDYNYYYDGIAFEISDLLVFVVVVVLRL